MTLSFSQLADCRFSQQQHFSKMATPNNKPNSPTNMSIDIANSPTTSNPSSLPSPVKFADLQQRTDATSTATNISTKPRRRQKNITTNYGEKTKSKKRYTTDPTRMGNIKGKLRMLGDNRNLRFRKLYKSPNPNVIYIFIGMIVTWYCLFSYFGPQNPPVIYKPRTATNNPDSNIVLETRKVTPKP